MRTSALQYLYLQKPVSSIILICIISILPWMLHPVYTTEEIKHVELSNSILVSGDWVLPKAPTGEIFSRPPMVHWLMALVSLPQGSLSVFTTRLPSILAFVILMVFVLLFLGRHLRFQEAFIAVLLLITCVGVRCVSISADANMIYSAFLLIGLFKMYRWENKLNLKGLPIIIPLMLSGAILTKGLAGVIYPLLIFGCYLVFLRKYTPLKIVKSLFYTGLTALFIPLIWYIEGARQGGSEFIQTALWGDLRSLIGMGDFGNDSVYGYGQTIFFPIIGFLPWTILLFCSLFGLSRKDFSPVDLVEKDQEEVRTRKKMRLFCSIAALGFFILIFLSGRNTFSAFLPAYPFIAIFVAQYILYLTENRSYVTRIFAGILAIASSVLVVVCFLVLGNLVNIGEVLVSYAKMNAETAKIIVEAVSLQNMSFVIPLFFVLAALVTAYYQLFKKINIKILYATIFLLFCSYLLLDGLVMKTYM